MLRYHNTFVSPYFVANVTFASYFFYLKNFTMKGKAKYFTLAITGDKDEFMRRFKSLKRKIEYARDEDLSTRKFLEMLIEQHEIKSKANP